MKIEQVDPKIIKNETWAGRRYDFDEVMEQLKKLGSIRITELKNINSFKSGFYDYRKRRGLLEKIGVKMDNKANVLYIYQKGE